MPSAWSSDVCSSDRKSTRLNSSHTIISYAGFCFEKKNGRTGTAMHLGWRVVQSVGRAPLTAADIPLWPRLWQHDCLVPFVGVLFSFFFLMNRGPPKFTLFPYPAPLPI